MNIFDGVTFDEFGQLHSKDGCMYENKIDYIMYEVLGFCGCGSPEDSLKFVRDVLEAIDLDFTIRTKCLKNIFDDKYGLEYFVYYCLDNLGLIEHGSSVPGWLNDKGRGVLEELRKIDFDRLLDED